MKDQKSGYLLAGIFGAVIGALTIVSVTRAIPSMMTRVMRKMMAEMAAGGCNPEEM